MGVNDSSAAVQPETVQQPDSSTSSSSISNGRESVAATPAAGMTEASTNKVVATDIPPKQVPLEQPATQRQRKPAKADDRSREGNLPGFQVGFFPAYCQGPLEVWEATAEELEQVQRSPALQR